MRAIFTALKFRKAPAEAEGDRATATERRSPLAAASDNYEQIKVRFNGIDAREKAAVRRALETGNVRAGLPEGSCARLPDN